MFFRVLKVIWKDATAKVEAEDRDKLQQQFEADPERAEALAKIKAEKAAIARHERFQEFMIDDPWSVELLGSLAKEIGRTLQLTNQDGRTLQWVDSRWQVIDEWGE